MLVLVVVAAAALLAAGCTTTPGGNQTANNTTVGVLYSQGVGPMPNLLATKQIDGYIAWQPFVSIGTESQIAQLVEPSQDLPPAGEWINHPCCVLSARDDLLASNPDFVNSISAITMLGSQYIAEHPEESADILANWFVGRSNFTYGNVSVGSVNVMENAIGTVRYTNDPTPQWVNDTKKFVAAQKDLGLITGQLANASNAQMNAIIFDFGPYRAASQQVAAKQFVTPQKASAPITLGYLKADMHSAALLVAIQKSQYMKETYGIALVPRDPSKASPDVCDLVVNGQTVAEVRLIAANAGPELMQLAATNSAQMTFAGVPPAMAAIDKGTPIKVLHPINNEGSGLVATAGSPAKDWPSFVAWAKARSAAGQPLKIAAPSKGSIQDVMLRFALKDAGFTITQG
jgi:ABC-type nitrate/sulfonate/bicarbonate transport system substrate-binding protein